MVRSASNAWAAKLDVKNHYPTVPVEHLFFLLQSFGVYPTTIANVGTFLDALHQFPRIPGGVPTGPEASAILGTASLVPLDRILARHDLVAVRWMDDIDMFATSEGSIRSAIEEV